MANQNRARQQPAAGTFELVFRTDPSIYDGRFANNGWLQELPKPLTKVTWDNVAIVSPNSAQQLVGADQRRRRRQRREHYVPVIDLVNPQGQTVARPLWIMPGSLMASSRSISVMVVVGWPVGNVGERRALMLTRFERRSRRGPRRRSGAKTGGRYLLATTQLHFNLEDPNFSTEERDIVRSETLEHFLTRRGHHRGTRASVALSRIRLQKPGENAPNYAWGMAIDLNNCIGCNACTIACQSGKQHSRRRQDRSGTQSRDALDSRRYLLQRLRSESS